MKHFFIIIISHFGDDMLRESMFLKAERYSPHHLPITCTFILCTCSVIVRRAVGCIYGVCKCGMLCSAQLCSFDWDVLYLAQSVLECDLVSEAFSSNVLSLFVGTVHGLHFCGHFPRGQEMTGRTCEQQHHLNLEV